MGNFIDLTAKRFGRWTVLYQKGKANDGHLYWECICDCGTKAMVDGRALRRGVSKSCGCLARELTVIRNLTHGRTKTPTYSVWRDMRSRCQRKADTCYRYYGGRGISVCERWNSFENFLEDMGERPDGLTIDRIDNNGNYEPDNCRWATRKEQSRHTRQNKMITYQGKSQCLTDWASELSVNKITLAYRLKHYPPQIAFNM